MSRLTRFNGDARDYGKMRPNQDTPPEDTPEWKNIEAALSDIEWKRCQERVMKLFSRDGPWIACGAESKRASVVCGLCRWPFGVHAVRQPEREEIRAAVGGPEQECVSSGRRAWRTSTTA